VRQAHVICCNDNVEFVVLDDEALARCWLEELARADWKAGQATAAGPYDTFAKYRARMYWHLHTVGCES
jgi:hypothetical protein